MLAEVAACWDLYRRVAQKGPPDLATFPSPGVSWISPIHAMSCNALFTLAYEEDVEYDSQYDTWNAAITLWTQAWPHPWTELAIEDSLRKGTLHLAWGQPPGLWLIEVDQGALAWRTPCRIRALGVDERVGISKRGERPAGG